MLSSESLISPVIRGLHTSFQKQLAILVSINLITLDPEMICNNICSTIAHFDITNFQVYHKNWDVFFMVEYL